MIVAGMVLCCLSSGGTGFLFSFFSKGNSFLPWFFLRLGVYYQRNKILCLIVVSYGQCGMNKSHVMISTLPTLTLGERFPKPSVPKKQKRTPTLEL